MTAPPPAFPRSDTTQLRMTIAQHEQSLAGLKEMLERMEQPDIERRNPLFGQIGSVQGTEPPVSQPPPPGSYFPRSVVAGYPSGGRQASDLLPPPPGPAPGAPVPKVSKTLEAIQHWEEILFRPSLASAMLFVIMPVVEKIITAETMTQASEACADLDVWGQLTVAQRVALEDLFAWIYTELYSSTSVIPSNVLSNMAAASVAYDAAGPQ